MTVSSIETVRLVATNILADSYNRDCLLKLPGEVYEFEAVDEGEERSLASLTVQKTLWLKKNAMVIMILQTVNIIKEIFITFLTVLKKIFFSIKTMFMSKN